MDSKTGAQEKPVAAYTQKDVAPKELDEAINIGLVSNAQRAVLIGASKKMLDVRKHIELVAPTEARVLITGETGTGKNLVAQAIHLRHPSCSCHTFRRTNIGALVPELAASQLFGHKRGAFTGAYKDVEGIVLEANHGTLFLDEVSTAAQCVQIMLLTLLEAERINPVGAGRDDDRPKFQIRVLAATTLTPQQLLHLDSFRHELFYRLAEYVIELPPLRERKEDIPDLAGYFLFKANKKIRCAKEQGKRCRALMGLEKDALDYLCEKYDWPGNVRELDHVIRAAVVRSRVCPEAITLRKEWISFPDYRPRQLAAPPLTLAGVKSLDEKIALICQRELQATGGNKNAAAENLHVNIRTFNKYLAMAPPEQTAP